MKREHGKDSTLHVSDTPVRRTVPILVSGCFAAGLLLFGGPVANAQDTTIAAETTVVAADTAATDTTLVSGAAVAPDSTMVATADDSTPAGGLETGFGGTAPGSNSNRSGLIFAAVGSTVVVGVALRKLAKRSSPDTPQSLD
jgi:hypothetical protein